MRVLMWFAIGFTVGCIPGSYLPWSKWYILAAFLLLFLACLVWSLKKENIRRLSVALLGIAVSLLWMWGYQELHLESARSYDGETVSAVVELTDYSRPSLYGSAAYGKVTLDGSTYKIYAYLDTVELLKPGDCLRGDFRLRLTTLGGENEATHHQGKGVFLLAYAKGDTQILPCDSVPAKYFPAMLRQHISKLLEQNFPKDVEGFARALLLGDSSKLTYQEDTAFKTSGIRHVIAVSGLHISILCSFLYGVVGRKRFLTPLVGIPLLILFSAVAGFTPSVTRACIMQCLVMLAVVFDKKYDPPTAIAFAVLVILIVNPMAVTSVSLQLSVGCTIGIFLLSGRISRYILRIMHAPNDKSLRGKISRWIAATVGVTISATAVTTPLSAFYFGTVSLIGVLTNVLVLWIVSFVFYGIMLSCIFGALWLPLGKGIGWAVAFLIRYILQTSKLLSYIPYGAVYTCSIYIIIWLVMCYILLAIFLFFRKKRPGLLMGCVAFSLAISLFAAWLEPRGDRFRVTVMDVGQGQAILLQSDEQTYLVDCGGSSDTGAADTVAQHLLSQSVFRLDGLILTHYDIDHSGGVPHLLSRLYVDKLYLPDTLDDGQMKSFLGSSYKSRIRWIQTECTIENEVSKITLMPGKNNADENENCLCILFQAENCDILITGDRNQVGERELLKNYEIPKLDLLIAGHHGADTATGIEILSETQPKAVAISVDKDNTFGHPSKALLKRLKLFGCHVFRTDKDGMIIFRR